MTTVDEQALAHDPRDQQADAMVEALAHARLRSGMFGVRDDVHAPRLDRYTILERLGSGGFGTVFAAYDERLDRKVAIKVVRVGAGRRASERLVDEAKALAKLAHPNIVAVFDVNPLPGGEVVVAMEFIRGQTLAQWASQPRPWPELFEVFAQAARGLSAAHVASVVHRDFKPTNAIVGDDGRVRVLDFGLARVADGPSDPDDTTDRPLPATGVVGTAAYMPPEQHRGQPADARSDQYAWCVSVWEAVFGTVPYVGDTHEALLQAKLAGPPTPPDAPVPARVRAALTRGLDPEPSRRFDHMQGLVDAMIDTPSAWGRRLLWAAPVVLAAGGALAAAVVAPDDPCLGAAAGLDKIWNETVHDQVRDAFVATQRPYANRVADVVQETVQPWTQTWRDAQTQLCRARQQGTWSDTLLDRQAHCLRTRLSDLQARVHTWADADTTTVDKAEETAAALPSVSYCADPERLRQATPLPTDSGAVAQIEAWAARLSRARANEDAGRYQPAQDGADAVLIAYEQSAIDYPPIRARALIQRGRAASRLGQAKPARQDLEAGSLLALGNGQDRLFADAAAELVWELGQVGGRFDEGERWAKLGQAAIARTPDATVARAALHNNYGTILTTHDRYDEALAEHEARLSLVREQWGNEHPLTAASIVNIANVHNHRGDMEQALAGYDQGLQLFARAYGPDHPRALQVAENRMGVLWSSGRIADAVAAGVHVLQVQTRVLGPQHPDLAATLADLALIENNRGQPVQGLDYAVRARRILVEVDRQHTPVFHTVEIQRAQALSNLGRHDEAWGVATTLSTEVVATLGPDHMTVAHCEHMLGLIELARGNAEAALLHLVRAENGFDRHGNRNLAATTQIPQADALMQLQRLAQARAVAAAAVSTLRSDGQMQLQLQRARQMLQRIVTTSH